MMKSLMRLSKTQRSFWAVAIFIVAVVVLVAGVAVAPSFEGFVGGALSPMSYKHPEPMGPEDGKRLTPDNGSDWRSPLPNEPHLNIPSPSGDGIYLFYKNQVKPECCPSTYTTDRGCLCTTDADRELINSRGGNRTPYMDTI